VKARIFDIGLAAGLLVGVLTTAPAAAEPDLRLEVASYNVQFVMPDLPLLQHLVRDLPGQKPNVEPRARAIGKALACFDLIALQETINDRRRAELLGQLEADASTCGKRSRLPSGRMFATLAGPSLPDGSFLPLLDDELTLASRLPVESVDMQAFHEAVGADALAAKGVLHARLALGPGPADRLDVFTTHLQAHDDRTEIRRRQIEELAAFIRSRARVGGPVLVLGDFNLWGGDPERADPGSEYNRLLDALNRAVAPRRFVDLWLATHPRDPEAESGSKRRVLADGSVRPREKRIDFLLLAGADRAWPLDMRRDFLPSDLKVDGAPVGDLSSHAALLATIALTRPSETAVTAAGGLATSGASNEPLPRPSAAAVVAGPRRAPDRRSRP
jgi:endonuclease/exonuclease/phosphatase family metal-dependent hydrolase